MTIRRRQFLLAAASVSVAASGISTAEGAQKKIPLRCVGVEEHFSIPEIVAAMRSANRVYSNDLDIEYLYATAPADLAQTEAALVDFETLRLPAMDQAGVAKQVLSLTAPGVQVFKPDVALEFARLANDRVAEVVKRHPDRFAAMVALPPQDPQGAVAEMERGIQKLGFNGFIINSHTHGEYLDQAKFWPILEAAQALDRPIYIHPRSPSPAMAAPMTDYNMSGALWGFGVEAGTHAVRLIASGTLDRFPKLKVVFGHMGEAIPYWLSRLDINAVPGADSRIKNQLLPSEYFRRNLWIAVTGMPDPLVLQYCVKKIGADRILWSTDYPYAPAAPAVQLLDDAGLTDAQRELISHRNAESIFHLT